jgi:cytidine deaminase
MTKYDELVKEAINALKKCNVPTKGPLFSCAVLTKKGNVYSSGRYFSDSYSLTLHAEQAALAHAADHGEHKVVAMAAVGKDKRPVVPCSMCRQLIWENSRRSGIDIGIVVADKNNQYKIIKISKLVPYPWP